MHTILVNVLLCLFICSCNIDPGVGQPRHQYTELEHNLIIEELLKLLDGDTPAFKIEVWAKIAKEQNKKWKAGTQGFPQKRSARSLRQHFKDMLKHHNNLLNTSGKLPETLMRKITRAHSLKQGQGGYDRRWYNEAEEQFLIEELRKPSITQMLSKSTLEAIRKEHDERRLAEVAGFEIERTARSLGSHLYNLKQGVRLPTDVLQKFNMLPKGASSSTSTAQNQQIDMQVRIDETEDSQEMIEEIEDSQDHEIFEEILKNPITGLPRFQYSKVEDSFIIEELTNLLDGETPAFKTEVWDKIAEMHLEKWKTKTPGFPTKRSCTSLRQHFRDMFNAAVGNHSKRTVQLPETLMRKIAKAHSLKQGKGRFDRHWYYDEEDALIIEELRKPSTTNLLGKATLEAIRKEHDKKRLANATGFQIERTDKSLSAHLYNMKQSGRLPKDVLQKFHMFHEGESSSTSAAQNQQTDSQLTQEIIQETGEELDEDIYGFALNNPICDINRKDI